MSTIDRALDPMNDCRMERSGPQFVFRSTSAQARKLQILRSNISRAKVQTAISTVADRDAGNPACRPLAQHDRLRPSFFLPPDSTSAQKLGIGRAGTIAASLTVLPGIDMFGPLLIDPAIAGLETVRRWTNPSFGGDVGVWSFGAA